jgi:hypothetical protein
VFQSPSSDYGSSLHPDHAIVPARLDHLTVNTRWPKHSPDNSLVELESIRRDEWSNFKIDSVGEVSKQVQRVAVASFADDRRWPKPRPDVEHNENPDRLFPAPDDRSDLVCLNLHHRESFYFSIIETTTAAGCLFQPTMNRIPGNSLDSSNGGLDETFDTEGGHFIKGGATVLESVIQCSGGRAECLSTSPALVATTLPRPSRVKAVANDGSDVAFSRGRAVPIGTAETLHGFGILPAVELMAWN